MRELVLLCINQHTKFEVTCFTDSKDMIGGQNLKKMSRDHNRAPFKGDFSSVCWDMT